MLPTTSPAPRERLLQKLLALCRVKAVHQLSASDRCLVRDALAAVDELTAAAKTRAAAPTASDTETTSMASEPAPSRQVLESRLRQPTPVHQFVARRLGGAPPSTARAYASGAWKAATATAKETSVPSKIPRISAPVPTPTGTSKLRKPAIVVRPRAKPAPKQLAKVARPKPSSPPRPVFRLDLDSDFGMDLLEAITAQDSAELAIATAVQQLEQLLEWRVHVDDDGTLKIQVAPVEGQRLTVTDQQAQLAFLALEYSIESKLKTSRYFALDKVSRFWVSSRWLHARQRNIESHAAQVLDWTCAVRTAIGCYHGTMQVPQEDHDSLPVPVWRALSRQPKSCVNVDVQKIIADKIILSPPKLSLARAAYGVGAFTAQAIGQWAPSASAILLKTTKAEEDAVDKQYKLIGKLSTAKADLVAMQLHRSKFAEKWRDIGFAGRRALATWQEACDNAHASALQAVDNGLVACSRRICAMKDNADDDVEIIKILTAEDSFPGEDGEEDPFTLAYYQDTQVEIAQVHARIAQALNGPQEAASACLVLEDLRVIIGDMAVWADPRFDAHTNARPHERDAYRDLIMWCTKVLAETL